VLHVELVRFVLILVFTSIVMIFQLLNRDLGVTISHNLQSSELINIIVAKPHQRANAIFCCFLSCDTNLLVRAFNVYVGLRPLVEYNSVTWSPYLKQDIEATERVQRRFTKRLPGLNPTKTEDICFGTNPPLKSLSSLTSIEVAGLSVRRLSL